MNYSKNNIILIPYPFTDLSSQKVRPAVVVSSDKGTYEDVFIVPLTSRIYNLCDDEFCLQDWKESGLNVPTAVKRGCLLIDSNLIIRIIGSLSKTDSELVSNALKTWLEL
ncbi:MAG TPA: type II toxin-antitoxin system PemK/MazF family toxin [Spirochaetota bacterium]|jgi:mRNA interferase MazF|nr:type II toxin-antitoxin system PemK/MazF family toxin [Spirochaetota bacterium]HPM33130.1 type II toxin-antitoxin system PemK/MazF family toxin [Spirochaetota bacterium]HPY01893.1 type II toxin-antitoxin system PemK/MazF family toxin [Spirochaetota bacterium]HQA51754.1 type II toxin-antitoxin system PemK/MazF family toxin [Spirochaetota bacterium]